MRACMHVFPLIPPRASMQLPEIATLWLIMLALVTPEKEATEQTPQRARQALQKGEHWEAFS